MRVRFRSDPQRPRCPHWKTTTLDSCSRARQRKAKSLGRNHRAAPERLRDVSEPARGAKHDALFSSANASPAKRQMDLHALRLFLGAEGEYRRLRLSERQHRDAEPFQMGICRRKSTIGSGALGAARRLRVTSRRRTVMESCQACRPRSAISYSMECCGPAHGNPCARKQPQEWAGK